MLLRTNNTLQDLNELTWYANFCSSLGIRRYLEIGTYTGDTMYAVIANSPTGSLGVTVDPNLSPFSNTKVELSTLGYIIKEIQGDSKDSTVISTVRSLGPFDLVFIDGDHTYDGVKSDWENYHQLAHIVVIHDVMGRDNPFTEDVYRFWQELKVDKQYIEVNLANYQLGYGVIFR